MFVPIDDWFELHPQDDPNIFYRKLSCMSKSNLNANLKKFHRYETYCNVLKFHSVACDRPETNVRVTYNDKNGWHLSCCLKSIPREDFDRDVCSCEEDIAHPQRFFHKLERDQMHRCKLCKRFTPDSQEEVEMVNPSEREIDK